MNVVGVRSLNNTSNVYRCVAAHLSIEATWTPIHTTTVVVCCFYVHLTARLLSPASPSHTHNSFMNEWNQFGDLIWQTTIFFILVSDQRFTDKLRNGKRKNQELSCAIQIEDVLRSIRTLSIFYGHRKYHFKYSMVINYEHQISILSYLSFVNAVNFEGPSAYMVFGRQNLPIDHNNDD